MTSPFYDPRYWGTNIGKLVEREFTIDLQMLLSEGKILAFQQSKKLDKRGVDALVTRLDKTTVKINVMVDRRKTLQKHRRTNKRMSRRDPMRKNILLWRHNLNLDQSVRARDLWKTINEFNPTDE